MQPYSPYIHAKHCSEVHYLKSTALGWAHVISLTVPSGSSFLPHQTRDICFPLPYDFSFTIRSRCHSSQGTCHISRLPVYVFSPSTSQVLKEFSADSHKAMPITFLLLNSSQGSPKIKCLTVKLPHAQTLPFPFRFPFVSPLPPLHPAQGSSVLWPQLPRAVGVLERIINKYKIAVKDKAREQATLSCLPHTATRFDIKATRKIANLCFHANTRNSRNNSNQSASTLHPLKVLHIPVFSCFPLCSVSSWDLKW